ncbi:MAG TPA: FG-GAP-like repeat-containing protein [Candidatus Binatia bacterium]|nr:FG-GAP-like repeat-containing protein [Candidatus Binatia bacterium]
MTVGEGSSAEQILSATDDDGQSLTFFKLGGPDFLSVATTSPGTGSATGRIRLRPGFIDAGTSRGTIGVSDGIDGARKTFAITVTDAARSPSSAWAYLDSTSFPTVDDPGLTAMGDLNGDGIADLVVGHINTSAVSVFLGEGGVAFTLKSEFTPARNITSLSLGDFTGDSRPDLVVTDSYRGWLLEGLGDGTFGTPVLFPAGSYPGSSRAGDLNGDGVADLVVGNYNAGTVSVLLADGLGRFNTPVAYEAGPIPINLKLADLNLDGTLDIAVADYGGGVSILLGDGTGAFRETQHYPSAPNPFDLAIGDLNGDRLPDIATAANGRDSVSVLVGTGAGLFQTAPGFHPGYGGTAFSIRDFNADGRGDLAFAFVRGIVIFPGDGAGGFGPGVVAPTGFPDAPGFAIDATTLDLDGDGAADLIVPVRFQNRIAIVLSDPSVGVPLAARAFLSKPGPVQVGGGGSPYTCVSLEPISGAYENTSVNLSTLSMASTGTGDVGIIHAGLTQTGIVGDTDRNGIAEIQACFSRSDLQSLFSHVDDKATVSVTIEGLLNSGRPIRTPLEVRVKSSGVQAARISPNPANPGATLTFETRTPGAVRIRLFDLSGRLVRTVLESPLLDAGVHSVRIDGFDGAGRPISSGIVFFRIESADKIEGGRLAILR